MLAAKISIYLFALIVANFIVLWYGETGLIITSLFLIPFDFVIRCSLHENWKGTKLIINLGIILLISSGITYLINSDTIQIAKASFAAFITSQLMASIIYQIFIEKSFLLKVNLSDLIAIICDSIMFQIIAFHYINEKVLIMQVLLKAFGGILWYWLIFVKFAKFFKIK